MILEVSNKHHCKLNKILRNFCFEHNLWFSVVFEYYASCDFQLFLSITQVYVAFHTISHIKVLFFPDTTVEVRELLRFLLYLDILSKLSLLQRKHSKCMYARFLNFRCFINYLTAGMHAFCMFYLYLSLG